MGLIALVLVVAVGAIVIGIGISSEPTPVTPSNPVIPPPTETPPPVTPTDGEVAGGVITNICGGPNNPSGIGSANGTGCGGDGNADCINTGSASSGCTPDANEYIYVVACDGKTGIECSGAQGGRTIADNIKTGVKISDYLSQGCTIQIDVFADGVRPGGTDPVDFIVFQKNQCETTPPPPPTEAKCGESCTKNADCTDTNNRCGDNGKCVLKECKDDPSKCEANLCQLKPVTVACGGVCSTTSDCATGNSCSAGKCVLDVCATDPSKCTADLCTLDTPAPQCGDACTSTSDCPTDHSCNTTSGKCELTACVNGDNCDPTMCTVVPDEVKKCGESCSTNAECPNNHTCSNGQCVLNSCLPDKCTDGCSLPATAIISDSADRLILGILAMMLGLLAWRTNFHVQLFYGLGGRHITANFSDEERSQLEAEIIEQRYQQKLRQNKNRRQSTKSFEESLLED